MVDTAVLTDIGYQVNFLQKGMVKHLKLTLYNTHLRIENADTGELVEDIPLNEIRSIKATNLAFMALLSTQGTNLEIKTDKKTIKISWKDVDARRVLFGTAGYEYNIFSGHKRAKVWADTFDKLANTKLHKEE